MDRILFGGILAFVGLAIGVPSYFTRSREWPGMIAGFDPKRCSDVKGLTRWVGTWGMSFGASCLAVAVAVFALPNLMGPLGVALGVIAIITVVMSIKGCARFSTR
jgi:hypothetical protein